MMNALLGIGMTNYLGVLLDRVEKISGKVLIGVADDYLISIVGNKFRESIVIAEGSLRRHKVVLEDLGLKPSMVYALLGIADTLLAYTRIQIEEHDKKLRDIRSKLPLRWHL